MNPETETKNDTVKKFKFVSRRKKIMKGKIAPLGTFFFVVRLYHPKRGQFNVHLHLQSSISDSELDKLEISMYDAICKKYSL